jgi:hypothetical protein
LLFGTNTILANYFFVNSVGEKVSDFSGKFEVFAVARTQSYQVNGRTNLGLKLA